MFLRRKAAKRFSLLLLEDEEHYVKDWVAACRWVLCVRACVCVTEINCVCVCVAVASGG